MKRMIKLAASGMLLWATGCSGAGTSEMLGPQAAPASPSSSVPSAAVSGAAGGTAVAASAGRAATPTAASPSAAIPSTLGAPVAGSSSVTTPVGMNTPPNTAATAANGGTPQDEGCLKCKIPAECQAFPLEGLKYSPGGTTLPSKCRAFHPTTNNPYAIRCIDALPSFKTRFLGDEYCILPPPPDKGIQVGLHPQGNSEAYWKAMWAGDMSGYDTMAKDWVLKAGEERTQNYRSKDANNPMEMNYYRTYFRMRTGSHHMIVTLHDSTEPDGWIAGVGEALPGMFDPSSGASVGILGGEQRPDDGTPVSFEKPTEDAGLYLVWPKSPSIIFNMHHFNSSDNDLLREGWINIWWEEDAKQRVTWYMGLDIGQVIGLSVSPNKVADLHYSWPVNGDVRLIRVFGHRHFWTTNFSSWIKRKAGDVELAYQSFDWFDMPTYRYDSATKNPLINTMGLTDGAMSGVVTLHQGDQLHFNCHIEFTDERKATDPKAPTPQEIGTLRFANEAYNGEMCINFGNVTGGTLGLPAADTTAIPDFAKASKSGK